MMIHDVRIMKTYKFLEIVFVHPVVIENQERFILLKQVYIVLK